MTEVDAHAQAPEAPKFGAIALIDDGLRPMCFELIPETERDAVMALLQDAEVLEDFAVRGIEAAAVVAEPDAAIEALTDPGHPNGMAFAKISDVSATAVRYIERRQMMRQIAASIRAAGDCEVLELGPDDDLSDIARFDVVFIDYYLDDAEADGTRAEQIATEVQGRRDAGRNQQIVLMSTAEGVRAMRTEFRKKASIEAASFAFVAKRDLDEDWKVKAHLEMLARGMRHSPALGEYIAAVKKSAREAADALSAKIDDLDIGDFAYIQRIALHADGHPLGDYLGWLLSSHLTALAFEGDLRERQWAVDKMEFEDGPLSPSEPSVEVASLYHDALFARNLGPLTGHPRAAADSDVADVPMVQLGDVFLTSDRGSAVVVLSPDCDLAFSPDPKRPPNRNLGVILLFGDPNSVASEASKDPGSTTEGIVEGSEVYRIDWRFSSFQTVRLGGLAEFLASQGFDVSKRDRLRPIYSLKLQHELGNHLMRVGPPVMPPISRHVRSKIRFQLADRVENLDLDFGEVVVSQFKKKESVRFTPSLVSKLKAACVDLLDDLRAVLDAMPTEGEGADKARKALDFKVTALAGQVDGADVWSGLLGDQALPAAGECKKIRGSVYIAAGDGWPFPGQPAVVLVVGEDKADPEDGGGEAPERPDDRLDVGAPAEQMRAASGGEARAAAAPMGAAGTEDRAAAPAKPAARPRKGK